MSQFNDPFDWKKYMDSDGRGGGENMDKSKGDEFFLSGEVFDGRQPFMYEVILLGDKYTPKDFLIYVLQEFFHNTRDAAKEKVVHMGKEGKYNCGIYTKDVAETKVMQVINFARNNCHPLQCIIQKSGDYAIRKT